MLENAQIVNLKCGDIEIWQQVCFLSSTKTVNPMNMIYKYRYKSYRTTIYYTPLIQKKTNILVISYFYLSNLMTKFEKNKVNKFKCL